jgi:hypothetical protein
MVWRSLVPHRERRLRYFYTDVYRLVDIYFEKDTDFENLRQLQQLELVVLALGLADVPNKLLPKLLLQVLTLRRDAGRPTWTFAPFSRSGVSEVYGPAVAEVLGEVHPVGQLPAVGKPTSAGNSAFKPRYRR